MRVLVLGASGATGREVVSQLIKKEIPVRILIRETSVLSDDLLKNPLVEVIRGNISEFDNSQMNKLTEECSSIISCLGHNMTFGGMFGKPRNLVSDAIKSVSTAVRKNADKKVRLILMSTTGYTNGVNGEKNSLGEKIVLSILKLLLPPHRDNMRAADYLIKEIGNDDEKLEWTAVRPDTLVNIDDETAYEICESPVRSPIFNAGPSSRINVAHFMAELSVNENLWLKWKGKTPILYNK